MRLWYRHLWRKKSLTFWLLLSTIGDRESVSSIRRTQVEGRTERISSVTRKFIFCDSLTTLIYTSNIGAATCSLACRNGGTCTSKNFCKCPEDFAGAQCQYSVDRCSPKRVGFNGGFSCGGTQTGLRCTLTCPAGIDFEFPAASSYTCNFETGAFTPARLPNCDYGTTCLYHMFKFKLNTRLSYRWRCSANHSTSF